MWCDSVNITDYVALARRLYDVARRMPPVDVVREFGVTARRYSREEYQPVRMLKNASARKVA